MPRVRPRYAALVAATIILTACSVGKTTITFPHPSGTGEAVQNQVGLAVDGSGRVIVARANGDSPLRGAAARLTPGLRLDKTFASTGQVVLPAGYTGTFHAAAIDTHGRVLVGGRANGISGPGAAEDFTIWRLDANGVPDPTFGSGGLATVDFGLNDSLTNMALLPDDSVVAVGVDAAPTRLVVAKLTPSGTLDPTFGTGGRFTWTLAGTSTSGTSIAVQSDGKIVLTGAIEPNECCNITRGVLLRLGGDGTLDPSFGSGGATIFQFFAEPARSVPYAVTLQTDGKILVGGYAWPTLSPTVDYRTLVARFDAEGALDPAFGTSGVSLTDLQPAGAEEVAYDLAIDSVGRVLVADIAPNGRWIVERLLPNGQRDLTYGVAGASVSITNPAQEVVYAPRIRVLADDSLMIAGGNGANMTVAHLNPSGTALVAGLIP